MPSKESMKIWGVWIGVESWCRVGAAEMSIPKLAAAGLASVGTGFPEVMGLCKGKPSLSLNLIKSPLCGRGEWAGGGVVNKTG